MSYADPGQVAPPPSIQIAPSILAADWAAMGPAVDVVTDGGADAIHVDVMDGHFVPELTFGRQLVAALRPRTSLPLDVHLMVLNPERHIEPMIAAGADQVTVHLEAAPEPDSLRRLLANIRAHGARAGIALRPLTPAQLLAGLWDLLDTVLVMTVEPGYGGQPFRAELLPKVRAVARQAAAQRRRRSSPLTGALTAIRRRRWRRPGPPTSWPGLRCMARPIRRRRWRPCAPARVWT